MMRLCMRDLLPCLLRILNLAQDKTKSSEAKIKPASSGANWKKLKSPIKSYLNDVLSVKYYLLYF